MRLSDKIKQMEAEVGLVPMVCLETQCSKRRVELMSRELSYGKLHCREQIPYVKRVEGNIRILDLCTYKIEEYWKKP